MIVLETLRISGFMAFDEGPYVIPLEQQGLVFVVGVNKTSSSADSNGSGKTSLFDAISWALYNKVLRGWNDIVNYRVQQATVELDFRVNQKHYRVVNTRGRHGHKWLLYEQGHAEAIGKAEQLLPTILGLSFGSFKMTLLFGQGDLSRFAQLTDSQRKDILDELLDTSFAEQCQRIQHEISEMHESRQALEIALASWESELQAFHHEAESLSSIDASERMRLAKHWFTISDDVQRAMHELDQLYQTHRDLFRLYRRLQADQSSSWDFAKLTNNLTYLIGRLRREHAELSQQCTVAIEGDRCPTCFQSIETVKGQVQEKYAELLRGITGEIHRFERMQDDLESWSGPTIESDDVDHLLSHIQNNANLLRQSVQHVSEDDEVTLENIERLQKDLEVRIQECEIQLAVHQKKLQAIESDVTLREFWLEGFGHRGIKALLLREYEQFINERLRLYSQILANGEIDFEFSAYRALKSGRTKAEVGLAVRHSHGAKDYKGLSSGEKQRADLCLVFTLQDVVRELHSGAFSLVMYDEIFEHFDETGCESVMDFLGEQRRRFGSVFVISQNPKLLSYPSDHVILVTKHPEGSQINAR